MMKLIICLWRRAWGQAAGESLHFVELYAVGDSGMIRKTRRVGSERGSPRFYEGIAFFQNNGCRRVSM